ncbi:MAG: cysteine--tRNA ligase [bacterium]|nr:cysteine--tRNA ligase [bacterium]MBU1919083.1 cysteine--tRNA ligase [bacterium]
MIQIYNTQTRKKEEFTPIQEGKVKMYACGLTVYDYAHIGHARQQVTYDVISRYFKYRGYDVTYVRNITDIDDKIIKRANEQGIPYTELTEKFIKAFHSDVQALGLQTPTHEPRATEHIAEIIELIEKLIQNGLAYQVDNDVFYSVRSFKGYGKLSGKNIEDLESGARVDVMEKKKDPLDFALWKSAKPDEPKWASPWGEGRPGWHIECSVMSMKYLGETFDIHGGGRDLIFPHHENELAQSEGATKKPFVKYWVHNGFLNIDAEKMSKSLGNFLTIRDILKQFHPEVIRYFILTTHYRSPLDYTDQNVTNAQASLERFYTTQERLNTFVSAGQTPDKAQDVSDKLATFKEEFLASMDDDFNTAKVIGQVFEWVRFWNKALDENTASVSNVKNYLEIMADIHSVFGIFSSDTNNFLAALKEKAISDNELSEQDIQKLIVERKEAKKNKNFKRADEIRDELLAKGIQLKDLPDGTTTWSAV